MGAVVHVPSPCTVQCAGFLMYYSTEPRKPIMNKENRKQYYSTSTKCLLRVQHLFGFKNKDAAIATNIRCSTYSFNC